MPEFAAPPFHSFSFTLLEDRRPRSVFRMAAVGEGTYELHVEKGSAANPTFQFTRTVPQDVAQRFKDALQEIGVFNWDESYGNAPGRAGMRWTMTTVFKEGVFSVASKGGSDLPVGFDRMLEELYRLDFPRPAEKGDAAGRGGAQASGAGAPGSGGVPGFGSALGAMGFRGAGGLSAGDLGAYGATGGLGNLGGFGAGGLGGAGGAGSGGVDFSQLADMMGANGLSGLDSSEMNELLSNAQRNPEAFQQRMRDEFRHMSPDEQNRLLDALASTGMASRAWWERFLRG